MVDFAQTSQQMIRLFTKIPKNKLISINRFPLCTQKPKNSEQSLPPLQPNDFSLIDIRIGQIIQCWKHTQSQNLYCQKIKILKEPQKIVEIASGLRKFVELENMKGKVIVMANLKKRKIGGFQSHGMVICASKQDKTITELIVPDGQIGQRVVLQNYQQYFPQSRQLLSILNPKKKIVERCLQDFRTDGEGYVIWKGIKLKTKNCYLKSNLKNALVS